jgi:hypothetical protein
MNKLQDKIRKQSLYFMDGNQSKLARLDSEILKITYLEKLKIIGNKIGLKN